MNRNARLAHMTLALALPLWLAAACSSQGPDAMLASARSYLAKNDVPAAVIQLKNALGKDPNLAEGRFLLGLAMLETGNPAAAETELRKAAGARFPADKLVPELSEAMLQQGNFRKVIDEFGQPEWASGPGRTAALTATGKAQLALGNRDAASAAFAAATAANPQYAPALLGQARLAAYGGNLAESARIIDAALAASPEFAQGWTFKGDLLAAQGKRAESMAAYRKASEIAPYDPAPRGSIIAMLLQEGKREEAKSELAALRKISPDHPETLYFVALLAYQDGHFAEARDAMQKQMAISPDNLPGLALSGAIAYQLKSYEQAEANLLKALRINPNQRFARRVLVATYIQTARPLKARETLQPLLATDPDASTLSLAGNVYLQNGDAAKAEEYFQKAAALAPKQTAPRVAAALTRFAQGDAASAFQSLEAISDDDESGSARLALIAAHLRRHEYDAALGPIGELEKLHPNDPLPANLRGIALLGKGDKAGARQSFERSVSLNPLFTPAVEALARLDLEANNIAAARQRFENVLAKDPNNVLALLWLAQLKARTGASPTEVTGFISKAIGAAPDDPTPRLALITYYLGRHDAKAARTSAQEAERALPTDPNILDALARTQLATGDANQAIATYARLTQVQPQSSTAWLRLAQAQTAAKDKSAAVMSLRKALELKPDLALAQHGVVELELDAGKTQDALAMAREVQKQQPKDPIGYVLEGETYEFRKDWSGATNVYRAALKNVDSTELAIKLHTALRASRDPGADKFAGEWTARHTRDSTFRLYLASVARDRKDYAEAAKQYEAVLDITPDNALVLNNLAWVKGQLKDPKAIEYAEKANSLLPNQPNIMDTLGTLLVENGDTTRGVALLEKASLSAPEAATIRFNLAKGLIKAGRTADARKELEELAKLGDRFPMQSEVAQLLKGH